MSELLEIRCIAKSLAVIRGANQKVGALGENSQGPSGGENVGELCGVFRKCESDQRGYSKLP